LPRTARTPDHAKFNWSHHLNTTDDFVVFAFDFEGADLRKNMKQSVTPQQLARFRAANWI
jgi:hypothetical protein